MATPGNESFVKDPPNATVSVFSKDGGTVKDAVVVLKNPKLDGDRLTFNVQVLEGDLTGGDGAASIFIDIFGVWRRAAYRGAYYAGAAAAVGTAAAVGAAAAAPYYYGGYPPRPVCGYYPYPPWSGRLDRPPDMAKSGGHDADLSARPQNRPDRLLQCNRPSVRSAIEPVAALCQTDPFRYIGADWYPTSAGAP